MKYYRSQVEERIGYDFYVDIAEQVIKARQAKGWNQKQLANEVKWSMNRIARIELAQIRLKLPDLEQLAKRLDVDIDWMIKADIDSQIGECLYLVWSDKVEDFKLYIKATSKRLAFLKLEAKLNDAGVRFLDTRARAMVELVGTPITEREIKSKFKLKSNEDEEILPDD